MIDILDKFLVTGFYSGKIKYMPGTFGTLVGILIFQIISLNSLLNNIFLLLILFFLSLLLLNYSYKKLIFLNKDDKSIVIDEIFGYLMFMIFFEIIRPFCLLPMFIVGVPKLGVSRTPLDEFPITKYAIFINEI